MSHIEIVPKTNEVEVKPFSGLHSASDMLSMTTQYIMPTLPTANCFSLLAFFIERLPPEGASVSYPEIINSTCINSRATVCSTINQLENLGLIIIVSRNKRDTENVYRLDPNVTIAMPQAQVAYWLERGSSEIELPPAQTGSDSSKTRPPSSKTEPPKPSSKIKLPPSSKTELGQTSRIMGDSGASSKIELLTTLKTCINTCHDDMHESHVRMWEEQIKPALRSQMTEATYYTNFHPLDFCYRDGNRLVLFTKCSVAYAWIEHRYKPLILRTVQSMMDNKDIQTIEVLLDK